QDLVGRRGVRQPHFLPEQAVPDFEFFQGRGRGCIIAGVQARGQPALGRAGGMGGNQQREPGARVGAAAGRQVGQQPGLAGVGVQGETGGPLPQLLQGRSRFEPGVGVQEAGRQWLARAAGIAGLQQQGGGQSQRQQGGNAEIQQKRPDAPGGGGGGGGRRAGKKRLDRHETEMWATFRV